MKAIVLTRYGSPDNLEVRQLPIPEPGAGEILVKVHASTVTAADTMMRRAQPWISRLFLGFFRPRHAVTGTGFAGTVVGLGSDVTRFRIGEAVFGETGTTFGANAEYLLLPEDAVVLPKPDFLSFDAAATLTDGPLTSYNFLRKLGEIEPGHRVLINGASGSLGSAAVQLAKHFGAHVTGVSSTRNLDLIRRLGADRVIDYTTTDPTRDNAVYDLVFDTVGKLSFSRVRNILAPRGRFLSPVLGLGILWSTLKTSRSTGQRAIFSATGLLDPEDLRDYLRELLPIIEQGGLRPLIGRRLPLERTAEAHRYVDTGRKTGNLVLVV